MGQSIVSDEAEVDDEAHPTKATRHASLPVAMMGLTTRASSPTTFTPKTIILRRWGMNGLLPEDKHFSGSGEVEVVAHAVFFGAHVAAVEVGGRNFYGDVFDDFETESFEAFAFDGVVGH